MTRALSILLVLVLLAAGWQWHEASSARAELAAERLDITQQITRATTAARAEEKRRSIQIQEVQDAAHTSLQAAQADAGRARTTAERLRQHAAQLAASCTASNPAATPGSPPASAPGDLLADMQRRLDEAAGELAAYADSARIAGQLCERSYDALTPASR